MNITLFQKVLQKSTHLWKRLQSTGPYESYETRSRYPMLILYQAGYVLLMSVIFAVYLNTYTANMLFNVLPTILVQVLSIYLLLIGKYQPAVMLVCLYGISNNLIRAYFNLGGFGEDHIFYFTLRLNLSVWLAVAFSLSNRFVLLTVAVIFPGILFHPWPDPLAKTSAALIFIVVSILAISVRLVNHRHIEDIRIESQNRNQMLQETQRLNKALKIQIRDRRQAETRYRTLFESCPDGIGIARPDGGIVDINPAFLKLTGYGVEECRRHSLSDMTASEDKKRLSMYLEDLNRDAAPAGPLECRLTRKDGVIFPVSLQGWMNQDVEPLSRSLGAFIRDLTQEKALAQEKLSLEKRLRQSQKLEAIGTLAGGIAHDFNNILGVIIGQAELIETFEITKESPIYRQISQIKQAGYRAADLVGQILSFSRAADIRRQPIRLRLLVKETAKFMKATLPSTIQVKEVYHHRDAVIFGDPTQIHQVLMNLCTNAAYAMKKTGGELVISLSRLFLDEISANQYPDLKTGSYVEITVHDTGTGIDPSITHKVFDPYFTTKADGEGTGLGLSVVHGVVKQHEGHISIYSENSVGTTFRILLPEYANPSTEDEKAEPHKIIGGNERVLLVDDEPALVETGCRILRQMGYQVDGETDSLKALELFQANPERFDLVITDLTMPGMTGTELAAAIVRINPNIPIILCTGFAKGLTSEIIQKSGIRVCVNKPLNIFMLSQVIRQCFDEHAGDTIKL